jgi:hypothetical protein
VSDRDFCIYVHYTFVCFPHRAKNNNNNKVRAQPRQPSRVCEILAIHHSLVDEAIIIFILLFFIIIIFICALTYRRGSHRPFDDVLVRAIERPAHAEVFVSAYLSWRHSPITGTSDRPGIRHKYAAASSPILLCHIRLEGGAEKFTRLRSRAHRRFRPCRPGPPNYARCER